MKVKNAMLIAAVAIGISTGCDEIIKRAAGAQDNAEKDEPAETAVEASSEEKQAPAGKAPSGAGKAKVPLGEGRESVPECGAECMEVAEEISEIEVRERDTGARERMLEDLKERYGLGEWSQEKKKVVHREVNVTIVEKLAEGVNAAELGRLLQEEGDRDCRLLKGTRLDEYWINECRFKAGTMTVRRNRCVGNGTFTLDVEGQYGKKRGKMESDGGYRCSFQEIYRATMDDQRPSGVWKRMTVLNPKKKAARKLGKVERAVRWLKKLKK